MKDTKELRDEKGRYKPSQHEQSFRWSEQLVREHLPKIKVKLKGEIREAHLAGSRDQFATLIIDGGRHEASWQTVVLCLNGDRPVLLD